jgi:hypothetical protein
MPWRSADGTSNAEPVFNKVNGLGSSSFSWAL